VREGSRFWTQGGVGGLEGEKEEPEDDARGKKKRTKREITTAYGEKKNAEEKKEGFGKKSAEDISMHGEGSRVQLDLVLLNIEKKARCSQPDTTSLQEGVTSLKRGNGRDFFSGRYRSGKRVKNGEIRGGVNGEGERTE